MKTETFTFNKHAVQGFVQRPLDVDQKVLGDRLLPFCPSNSCLVGDKILLPLKFRDTALGDVTDSDHSPPPLRRDSIFCKRLYIN